MFVWAGGLQVASQYRCTVRPQIQLSLKNDAFLATAPHVFHALQE